MSKLIKCKVCKNLVSTGADSCPHCGEKNFRGEGKWVVVDKIKCHNCKGYGGYIIEEVMRIGAGDMMRKSQNKKYDPDWKSWFDFFSGTKEVRRNSQTGLSTYPEICYICKGTGLEEMKKIKFEDEL